MTGTLAISWGSGGGFYVHRQRICLGRVALTYVPKVEIDDLMEAYAAGADPCPSRSRIDGLRCAKQRGHGGLHGAGNTSWNL